MISILRKNPSCISTTYSNYAYDGGALTSLWAPNFTGAKLFMLDDWLFLANTVSPGLKIDNTVYVPEATTIYGRAWFKRQNSPISGYTIYYASGMFVYDVKDASGGKAYAGYVPKEKYNSTTGKWEGDSFYSATNLPRPYSPEVTFTPRGTLRNANTPAITAQFWLPGWQKYAYDEMFNIQVIGEYAPRDGATGKAFVGIPRWIDNNGQIYERSLTASGNGYRYGAIYPYAVNYWIIGDYPSDDGWYVGEEPRLDREVVFKHTKPVGHPAHKDDIVVSFLDRIIGDNKNDIYLGEIARWL